MKNSCATCDAVADCQKAFGKYWREKSRGGVGCETKFAGWKRRRARPAAVGTKKAKLPYQEEF